MAIRGRNRAFAIQLLILCSCGCVTEPEDHQGTLDIVVEPTVSKIDLRYFPDRLVHSVTLEPPTSEYSISISVPTPEWVCGNYIVDVMLPDGRTGYQHLSYTTGGLLEGLSTPEERSEFCFLRNGETQQHRISSFVVDGVLWP